MSLIYTAPIVAGGGGGSAGRRHGLYIGGRADAKSRKKLDGLGITHVLNVTPEKEACIQSGIPNYFEKEGRLTYKRVPVYDSSTSDLLSQADPVVGFISSGLHHGSVLVHCKLGVSRSATCVIFFLIRKLGMTFDKALALCQERRPDVNPIPAFVVQIQKYEAKCRKLGIVKDDDGGGYQSKKRKAPIGPSVGPARGPLQRSAASPPLNETYGLQMPGPSQEDVPEKKAKITLPVCGPMDGPAIGPVTGTSLNTTAGPQLPEAIKGEYAGTINWALLEK